MSTRLDDYRHLVIAYFHQEFSDIPLNILLCMIPKTISLKVEKVVALHYRIRKPPADAAGFMMRLFRPRFKSLIKVECYEP